MAKRRKAKVAPVDGGFGPREIKRLRQVCRDVWRYSHPWKLVSQRCALPKDSNGDVYYKCEGCKKKVPKIYVDHINKVGQVDDGFLNRLFCSSKFLQGLCKKCHDKKTKEEREQDKLDALLGV